MSKSLIDEYEKMLSAVNKYSSNRIERRIEFKDYVITKNFFEYNEVIFNNPATIVLWKDSTKTVVKCGKNDIFDPEKGLALCFMKRALEGTGGSFHKVLKKEIKMEVKRENEGRVYIDSKSKPIEN